ELLGYVPLDDGLLDVYRTSHVFLHVSWTEGLPQVLFEASAAGTPVVATDTGGVGAAGKEARSLCHRAMPPPQPRQLPDWRTTWRCVGDWSRRVSTGRRHTPSRLSGRVSFAFSAPRTIGLEKACPSTQPRRLFRPVAHAGTART